MKTFRFIVPVVVLVVINSLLIYPYLFADAPGWVESIEVSFISMGRFWAQNFPHVFWNPVWYAGYPMRFSYVPIVPVGTALLGLLIGSFGRSYHLISGMAYILVPVSLYFFIRHVTKNSFAALAGALGFSLLPSLGNMFAEVRAAQGLFEAGSLPPWRVMVMVFYGEGPHTVSMAFLPWAGLLFLKALEEGRRRFIVLAAVFLALTGLANPIGLWAALILIAAIMVVSVVWGQPLQLTIVRSGIIFALAYLFMAFWYTPGFISSDFFKEGGGLLSTVLGYFPWRPVGMLALFGALLFGLRRFVPSLRTAVVFVWFVLMVFIVGVFYLWGVEFAPQARRYIPELDMAGATLLAIAVANVSELAKRKFQRLPGWAIPLTVITVIVMVSLPVWGASLWFTSATNAPATGPRERFMNAWLAKNTGPTERIFLSANYSFWADLDTDVWQLRGGHWQASTNPWERHAGYQITSGQDEDVSLLWLRIFSISKILVNGNGSSVHYRDYQYPDKFLGLPSLGCIICPGDVVYRVPDAVGMAVAVDMEEGKHLVPPANGADKEALSAYVSWLEKTATPFTFTRVNNDNYTLRGSLHDGQGIRVAMSYDPGFFARDQNGKTLTVAKDPLGFLLIGGVPAGETTVTLTYGPTWDFYIGWVLFAAGIVWAVHSKITPL